MDDAGHQIDVSQIDVSSMEPAWVTMTDLDGSNPRRVLRVPLREEFLIREVPEDES